MQYYGRSYKIMSDIHFKCLCGSKGAFEFKFVNSAQWTQ